VKKFGAKKMKLDKNLRSFDGLKIAYRITRKNKPFLIFVEGLSGNFTGWQYQIKFFEKKGYSTIAYDLRGHGKSGIPKNLDFSFDAFSKDLYEILKKEKVNKAIFITNCFGSMICQHFYNKHPEKVRAIVLMNTSHKSPYHGFEQNRYFVNIVSGFYSFLLSLLNRKFIRELNYPYLESSKVVNYPSWIDFAASTFIYTNLITIVGVYQTMLDFNFAKILKKIKVPTLLIATKKDQIFSVKDLERMHSLIKNSKFVLADGDHLAFLKKSGKINSVLYDFIKRL
jgi:pimeloyl-ACP methyl ester carboxylesterase